MRRPEFIARQSSRPSGALGRVLAWIMARETANLNERAVAALDLRPTDRVLEIGFGHGRTVQRIAAAVPDGQVAGIDVSESMTRLANRRNRSAVAAGRVELRTGDAASLPFADGQFDKALSVHTIYFWPDLAACLRELHRVLRPGGALVLGFASKDNPRIAGYPASVYTFRDDREVAELLRAAGFASANLVPAATATLAIGLKP